MPVWKSWAGRAVVLVAIELPWGLLIHWADGAFGIRDSSIHPFLQIPGIVLGVGLGRVVFPIQPRLKPQ